MPSTATIRAQNFATLGEAVYARRPMQVAPRRRSRTAISALLAFVAVACKNTGGTGPSPSLEERFNAALDRPSTSPSSAPGAGASAQTQEAPGEVAANGSEDEESMELDESLLAKRFQRGAAAGGDWKIDLGSLHKGASEGHDEYTAPLLDGAGGVAHLTVDAALQNTADRLLAEYGIPEASIVMIRPRDGKILVYSSRSASKPHADLIVEATAPSASLFKIVTAASLVEHAGMNAESTQCFAGGGMHRITEKDLQVDPKKDTVCPTLASAMGHSTNTVFARAATQRLTPATLAETARAFRYDGVLPFDIAVEPSALQIPEDRLGFARTAAGFWNTSLSPLHAAWIAATVANHGEAMRPYVVGSLESHGRTVYTAQESRGLGRVFSAAAADAVTRMMENTVVEGTSRKAFRDPRGRPFLPQLSIAGKTGTLSDDRAGRFYTWFSGFAPSRPTSVEPVAIAVLAVNGVNWKVKANTVAREMLRAYFAAADVPGVTPPTRARAAAPAVPKAAKPAKRDDKKIVNVPLRSPCATAPSGAHSAGCATAPSGAHSPGCATAPSGAHSPGCATAPSGAHSPGCAAAPGGAHSPGCATAPSGAHSAGCANAAHPHQAGRPPSAVTSADALAWLASGEVAAALMSSGPQSGEHLNTARDPSTSGRRGCIEVVCGSMFSGKTEELLRRVKRARLAKQPVLLFKPRVDNRYDDTKVVTHEGLAGDAVPVADPAELLRFVPLDATAVVGIDEVQFFDHAIVEVAEKLANAGVRVICAGLDQDYLGRPFGPMPALMAAAEFVTKLHAICAKCGGLASRSQRLVASEGQLFVGGAAAYEARCRHCWVSGVDHARNPGSSASLLP